MAELSAVPFSALPQASDGYTVLYENDQVCRSEKKLSELVGNKTSSFLTKEQGDSLYQEKGDYLVDDDITGKLDKEQYANDSATFLTAHQNLDEYATLEWVNNQGFLKEHQPISANEWNDVYETVVTNSGTWETETNWTDDINAASANALSEAKDWVENQNYITGVDLTNYYTKSETSGANEISAALDGKEDKVFVAEYGVTTYADIKAAYDAGKQIICKYVENEAQTKYISLSQFVKPANIFIFSDWATNGQSIYVHFTLNYDGTTGYQVISDWYYTRNDTSGRNELASAFNTKQDKLTFAGTNNTITSINNSAVGVDTGGDYVPLSATDCRIGSKNKNLDDNNIFAQGAENSAGAYSLSQGKYNYSNFHSLAQGYQNSANSNALAQGMNNSANGDSLAQGTLCYAINESIAQGENNSAMNYSFAQGKNNSAYNYGFAAGTGNSANTTAAALGQNCSSYYWSIANGDKCSATDRSLAQGERTYADLYSLSQGFRTSATTYSLSQGDTCYATQYSFAQGLNCSSYGYGTFAQGMKCVATGSYSFAQGYYTTAKSNSQAMGYKLLIQDTAMAIGEYNKTTNSANESAAFVIGNGTNNNRSDAFVVYKNGIASGGDFITSAGKKLSDCITTLPTNYVTSGDEISGNKQYALTTAGWEEITGGGNGGAYVPLNAVECTIGSGNTSISGSLAQGENNSAGYIIVYPEATIEDEFIPEHSAVLGYSFAQGKDNLSYSSSLAQGVSNSATYGSFAQGLTNYSNYLSVCFGYNNSAEGFSFAQGSGNTAYEYSFAQGSTTTATYNSIAMGNYLKANTYSVAIGSGLSASSYSFNFGVYNSAENYSQTFGYGLRATNYATAYGYDDAVITLGSFVIGEFNKTSAAPFVIGNGTSDNTRSDLFVVDKDGNVSAQGQIYAGGGVLGAALDTLELSPDNETIEFVTSSHNVVNGGVEPDEYTVIKIKTSLLNKINELYNLVSSNSGNSNWTLPQ